MRPNESGGSVFVRMIGSGDHAPARQLRVIHEAHLSSQHPRQMPAILRSM